MIDASALGLNDQGFSVAVYVAAVDEPTNKLLDASITVDFSETAASILVQGAATFIALMLATVI